jgi:hypothetical protein
MVGDTSPCPKVPLGSRAVPRGCSQHGELASAWRDTAQLAAEVVPDAYPGHRAPDLPRPPTQTRRSARPAPPYHPGAAPAVMMGIQERGQGSGSHPAACSRFCRWRAGGTAMAVLTIGVARCSCRAPRNSGLTAPMRHPTGPGCSTARLGGLDCPAITHQWVPSSTARHRPERRSDGGQMIFEALPAAREPGPDLGFRGAPLRNRTVDLLLTIDSLRELVSAVWTFTSMPLVFPSLCETVMCGAYCQRLSAPLRKASGPMQCQKPLMH